jgi:hypothetical protein
MIKRNKIYKERELTRSSRLEKVAGGSGTECWPQVVGTSPAAAA